MCARSRSRKTDSVSRSLHPQTAVFSDGVRTGSWGLKVPTAARYTCMPSRSPSYVATSSSIASYARSLCFSLGNTLQAGRLNCIRSFGPRSECSSKRECSPLFGVNAERFLPLECRAMPRNDVQVQSITAEYSLFELL